MKKTTKTRGKYGSGLFDNATKAINTRKATQSSRLSSIMGEIGKTRGKSTKKTSAKKKSR